MNEIVKKHLSPSQIKMYIKCSAQWMFRYREGLKMKPGIALLYGISADVAFNLNYGQKIITYEDLPVDDVTDAFTTTWDDRKDNYDLTDPKGQKPEDIRENGIKLTRVWHKERAPEVQPIAIQQPLHIEFPDYEYDIIQYADLITEDAVIDNKTAGKSPPKDKETGLYRPASFDDEIQLNMYDMGYEIHYGYRPKILGLDYMVKTKTPLVRSVTWAPNDADRTFILNLIGHVVNGIKKEHFMPNRGHFMCSKKYCGFWEKCEENWAGKVKE